MLTTTTTDRSPYWIALGDIAVFGLFAAIGRGAHRSSVDPLEILSIAAPFAIGWLAAAPWMGMYKTDIASQVTPVLQRTALTWGIAGGIGLGLRKLVWGKDVPLSFAITTLLINLMLLALWRTSVAIYRARKYSV